MMLKNSTTVKQILFGGLLLAAVFAIGCNNSEKKEGAESAEPAVNSVVPDTMKPPATTPAPDTTKKMDTASIRPTKTPTRNKA